MWLEVKSKESTSIHQPINFINSGNLAHVEKKQTHRKADGGETSTVGGRNIQWVGEMSWGQNDQGAKRPVKGRNV